MGFFNPFGGGGSGSSGDSYSKIQINEMLKNKVDAVKGKVLTTNDFTNEYKDKIEKLQNPILIKGRVNTINDLPSAPQIGDWYYVGRENDTVKTIYLYTETGWDNLGTTEVDLSNYIKDTDYATNTKFGIVRIGQGLRVKDGVISIDKEFLDFSAVELVYDGNYIYLNNERVNFLEIADFCLTESYFTYLIYNKSLYIPFLVSEEKIVFENIFIDNGNIRIRIVEIDNLDNVYFDTITMETISNKTLVIDNLSTNEQYPSAKAVYNAILHNIDDIVTEDSENSVKSSGIYDFVNSSISTNTAHYIGQFNSENDLNAYNGDLTNNDYAFVVNKNNLGNVESYIRYKYVDTGAAQEWKEEYTLNNSSFTANQWAAINSGLTSNDKNEINKISNLITNLEQLQDTVDKLNTDVDNKLDTDSNLSNNDIDNIFNKIFN